jgi:OmpA-OmpF porin, OOP family
MSNLLDSIKGYITPELIGQAAGALGESESGIGKAVSGLAPTILAGILNKSGDAGSMGSIFNLLSDSRNAGFLDNLGGLIGGGNLAQNDPKDIAGNLMGSLFGGKVPAILNAISAFSGVKSSSTSSLLGLVGPLVMGVLGKKISNDGLNVSGLLNLLQGEKNSILSALPSGLSSVMGLAGGLGGNLPKIDTDTESSGGNRWLLPLLLLLALGLGAMYYLKNCSGKPAEAKPMVTAPAPAPAPAPTTTEAPKFNFPEGSQEAAMLAFVMNRSAIDKSIWFDFPEIMFDVNKATLKPESEAKLNAVLSILKEFPAVKLKVGGYTDSDGNDAANKKLSDERAKAAAAWLTAKGIAADRLDAEGYGEENPVAKNDTPENKAKNRRISFSVRAK